jgi:uncharacterized repeat protein (TIGR03803 family)
LISSVAAAQPRYEVIRAFGPFKGGEPHAPLIQASDGAFYGTAFQGGTRGGWGIIFRISSDGSSFSVLHSFGFDDGAYPYAALLEGSDGFLYGTAAYGSRLHGIVFRIATDGSGFSVIHSFNGTDGSIPLAELVELPDGALYGTTELGGSSGGGTVFRVSTDGSSFSVIHEFVDYADGWQPRAPLTLGSDGALYGTTFFGGLPGGTVFKLLPDGSSFTVLHRFQRPSGCCPHAGLIQGPDGAFYGTTYGADFDIGTVFKISADGSSYQDLHSFDRGVHPQGEVALGSDGALYGSTRHGGVAGRGTLFRISIDGSSFETLRTFDNEGGPEEPVAALLSAADGAFYGTTLHGGRSDMGTIYRLSGDGSSLTVFHSFDNDGFIGNSALVQGSNGALFGTTQSGGTAGGLGTVFKLSPDGSQFSTLHSLAHVDGSHPYNAPLTEGADGAFYGTAEAGGAFDAGTVFRVAADGSSFSVLHDFDGTQGRTPRTGLLLGVDGVLYGTTWAGGSVGAGTVFRIMADGSSFSVLHNFDFVGVNGWAKPLLGLLQGSDRALYGATSGAVFKLSTDGSGYTVLQRDVSPFGPRLLTGSDGFFYGVSWAHGDFNKGAVFKLSPDFSAFEILHSFNDSDGATPAGLSFGSDGNLYGATYGGGALGYGTLFKISTDGTGFAILHNFDMVTGGRPYAALLKGADGSFYGTATEGGPGGYGVVYRMRYDIPDSIVQFVTSAVTVSEAGKAAVLTLARTGSKRSELTVDFTTSEDTATAGVDFVAATGRVRFARGAGTAVLKVILAADKSYEGNETFSVTLSNPQGRGAILGRRDAALVTIRDDDPVPTLQLSASTYSALEGSSANVTIRRTGASGDPVTVFFTTADGTAIAPDDYTRTATGVIFGAGVLSRTVSVPIASDSSPEGPEYLVIELSNADGAILGKLSKAELRIRDHYQSVGFPFASFTAREQSGKALITVRRAGQATSMLAVDYATLDTSGPAMPDADYTPTSGRLVFRPGVVSRTFTVPIRNDTLEEGTESLSLVLSNSDPPGALGPNFIAQLYIIDDEPTVQFSTPRYYVSEPARTATREVVIPVTRRGRLQETVHVDYATSGATASAGVHHIDVSGHLTFGPGVRQLTFRVPILGNAIDGPDPSTVNLMLFLVDIPLGSPSDSILIIRDNDGR